MIYWKNQAFLLGVSPSFSIQQLPTNTWKQIHINSLTQHTHESDYELNEVVWFNPIYI